MTTRSNYPYSGVDAANKESGPLIHETPPQRRGISKWIKIGVPVAIVVVIAAVLGGVLGSRASKNNRDTLENTTQGNTESGGNSGNGGGANGGKFRFATATNSQFMVPLYPSTTNAAAFTTPTVLAAGGWPDDPFSPSSPDPVTVREDRPRLIAPQYKWDALPTLISGDPYMKAWNDTIFGNATDYLSRPPVVYNMDGSSGILDNAREVKQRIKAFGYAYRLTRDQQWADRAYAELQNAASFGPASAAEDRWNTGHFLDAAEFTAAFGIAYDWFYDVFDDGQKGMVRDAMIRFGLRPGLSVFTGGGASFGWWSRDVNGNWNCVCNGGLTIGALAILGDDTTGVAEQLLGHTIDNARDNCVRGPSSDGTWSETPNYWYFGTTGHAEMVSALLTATGSDYGLLETNPGFELTGLSHMAHYGPTSLFDYGDHGPNKFSATANCMFLYAEHYNEPQYALFQREQADAAEPWSMFWYNPATSGAFWNGADLDLFFDDASDQWAAMRSSWTDFNALFVAIKAGRNQGHQAHNDLDAGDFVLDALGTRWAGELGSGDYLSPGYFASDAQDAVRWQYYRKMTEGQNTLLIGEGNQNVQAAPTVRHDTSGTKQGSSTVLDIPQDSNVFWTADLTSAYFDATTVKRGVRLINRRRQVLLQDEVTSSEDIQWRMHTNATIDTDGTTATLERDGKTMRVSILNAPEGAAFSSSPAARMSSDVTPPVADQGNPGVNVLIISLPAGSRRLEVLFNPQWPGMSESDYVTPRSVALDDWTLTSHD